MKKISLFLGGARSGKSSLAEKIAVEEGGDAVLYVATAEAGDEEMADRIARHQAARPESWRTLETPTGVGPAIKQAWQGEAVVLLDCITLLVNNLLPGGVGFEQVSVQVEEYERVVIAEIEALLEVVEQTEAHFLVVSNEVGMGLVPPYELGRAYRDILGRANRILAEAADEVFFLVAGIPMKIK